MVSEFSFLESNYFVPFHFFSIGPRYVLMNHHMLLHLKKNVSDHGPLESSSLYFLFLKIGMVTLETSMEHRTLQTR